MYISAVLRIWETKQWEKASYIKFWYAMAVTYRLRAFSEVMPITRTILPKDWYIIYPRHEDGTGILKTENQKKSN